MKSLHYFIIVIAFATTTLTSCSSDMFCIEGEGDIVTQKREVSEFAGIELQTEANVEVTQAQNISVEISDYENRQQHIICEVVDKKLIIRSEPRSACFDDESPNVKISMPISLTSLVISGSGNITTLSTFNDVSSIIISGSGNIKTNEAIRTESLSAVISGSGNITTKGSTNKLHVTISGSGNASMNELTAQDATCVIEGEGNAIVRVANSLSVTISGSGNVEYYGTPTITTTITGSGNVVKR